MYEFLPSIYLLAISLCIEIVFLSLWLMMENLMANIDAYKEALILKTKTKSCEWSYKTKILIYGISLI